MIFALLPVKAPAQAKHRLSELFTREEREKLARSMFEEALGALLAARGLDRVVVASSDAQILRRAALLGASAGPEPARERPGCTEPARGAGGRPPALCAGSMPGRPALVWPLSETIQNGHSSSADRAARKCMEWGATTLLMMPIDVPLVTAAEIEALLETALALPAPRLVIVPSADGTGTNALVRTPPDLVESCFGPHSFRAHLEQARAKGAVVEVARPRGLVFDLDTPEDLAQFLARAPSGPTAQLLRQMGAQERMSRAGGESE